MWLRKRIGDRVHFTIIPVNKRRSIPDGTLHAILGSKQTGLGRNGLDALIKKYK